MKPEILFVKYAFPCAFILRERNEITEEELSMIEQAALHEKILPRDFLERVFFRAFNRIDRLANEMKKRRWDYEVIHSYFVSRHNEIISNGSEAYEHAPDSLRELCKVYSAKIQSIQDTTLVVKYGDKIRPVCGEMIPFPKIGENVTIHYGYAIERVK
ncbi:MAG: HypC/HybG/HupF family hydrogenase formation chaperone [Candidatus Diapherotrites archaeon]